MRDGVTKNKRKSQERKRKKDCESSVRIRLIHNFISPSANGFSVFCLLHSQGSYSPKLCQPIMNLRKKSNLAYKSSGEGKRWTYKKSD